MKIKSKPSLLNSFLLVYFYELEKNLNQSDNKLKQVKFQSEESNTDEFLKKYFKSYISSNNSIQSSDLKELLIIVDENEYRIKITDLQSYQIKNVFLPEELTSIQKKDIAKQKHSVYTNPDIYLEISDGKNTYFESVELKSTKNNNIPGSSVQQISPFEWVIFVKRSKDKVNIATGYYLNSITTKLPFPDRSPRPQIGFKTLQSWNNKYRKVSDKVLSIESTSEFDKEKITLLKDWQDYLANEWIEIIKSDNVKKNEKWFNTALRKFAIKLLEYNKVLTEIEKQELKKKLKKLIK